MAGALRKEMEDTSDSCVEVVITERSGAEQPPASSEGRAAGEAGNRDPAQKPLRPEATGMAQLEEGCGEQSSLEQSALKEQEQSSLEQWELPSEGLSNQEVIRKNEQDVFEPHAPFSASLESTSSVINENCLTLPELRNSEREEQTSQKSVLSENTASGTVTGSMIEDDEALRRTRADFDETIQSEKLCLDQKYYPGKAVQQDYHMPDVVTVRVQRVWRQEETEWINRTLTGAERKAAFCGLLEKEAQLIAAIGRHKLNADEENQQKAILHFLDKCAQPKRWKAYDGKITEMDTQYTLHARELFEIYRSISMNDIPKDERIDVLLTLRHTVKEHECKLTQEIVELIDREVDLMSREVKECNLEGLRKRICTLFLQYIKTPKFNPEVARILKVPPDPLKLYKNVHFCHSCENYLPSTEFPVPANCRTIGRCRLCCKLDNEARRRDAFLTYKFILENLRKSEADYQDDAKIVYLVQHQDLQYLIENIWGCRSALSACGDLYDLVMVRWDKHREWSPWNTILLSRDEAGAHLKLCDLQKAYEAAFIQRIKHKHIQAKTYFAQIPVMTSFLHRSDNQANAN